VQLGRRSRQQRTVIEDDVFHRQRLAGHRACEARRGQLGRTGTSVTEDVSPDSFVISRGRQVTKARLREEGIGALSGGDSHLAGQEQ